MRVVSLFSGAGGADLGFEDDVIVFANEIWEPAIKTYQHNIGHHVFTQPVKYVADQPHIIPNCDVIIGGPPCQSFSNARTSGYKGGYRSCDGLGNVYAMLEICNVKRPSIIVLENAPTLTQPAMTSICNLFFEGFKSIGYHANLWKLNAADYGIPQNRTRSFFIGIRQVDYEDGVRFHRPITDYWSDYYTGWADYLGIKEDCLLVRRADKIKGQSPYAPSYPVIATETMAIRFNPGKIHKTSGKLLSAERDAYGVKQRYLRIDELAKLQGFPDDYKFFGNNAEQVKQIGNAWCVNVSRAIAKECRRIIWSV